VPEGERAEIAGALATLEQALAATPAELGRIRQARDAVTGRWPWLVEPLAIAFAQPAVGAALAAAARAYIEAAAPALPAAGNPGEGLVPPPAAGYNSHGS
jgi:hypothetical protein